MTCWLREIALAKALSHNESLANSPTINMAPLNGGDFPLNVKDMQQGNKILHKRKFSKQLVFFLMISINLNKICFVALFFKIEKL